MMLRWFREFAGRCCRSWRPPCLVFSMMMLTPDRDISLGGCGVVLPPRFGGSVPCTFSECPAGGAVTGTYDRRESAGVYDPECLGAISHSSRGFVARVLDNRHVLLMVHASGDFASGHPACAHIRSRSIS